MATTTKAPDAVSLGRRGGLARALSLTAEEREAAATLAGRATWAGTTPQQRSDEMRRRAEVRRSRRESARRGTAPGRGG